MTWELFRFAALTIVATTATLWLGLELAAGGDIRVETHWGGLGGTSSGWKASKALVALLVTVAAWIGVWGLSLTPPAAECPTDSANGSGAGPKVNQTPPGGAGTQGTTEKPVLNPPAPVADTVARDSDTPPLSVPSP